MEKENRNKNHERSLRLEAEQLRDIAPLQRKPILLQRFAADYLDLSKIGSLEGIDGV